MRLRKRDMQHDRAPPGGSRDGPLRRMPFRAGYLRRSIDRGFVGGGSAPAGISRSCRGRGMRDPFDWAGREGRSDRPVWFVFTGVALILIGLAASSAASYASIVF